MNRKLFFLALLCAAASVYAAEGQVYKWTDAAGIVHYSDAPPPKDTQNVQTVHVTGGDRPHAMPTENTEPGSKPKDEGAGNAPPQNAAPANAAAVLAAECKTARSNLEMLQSRSPVAVKNADGSTQALDDKARQAQIAAANAQIATYCQ